MNILYITIRSDIGGGPIHLNELIKNLDNPELNFFLACPFNGEVYRDYWEENRSILDTFELPYRKFTLKSILQLISFSKKNNIDIVHSHGKGGGIYSRLIKLFLPKVKVIHTFHGIDLTQKGVLNRIKNVYLERILKHFTNLFIAVSHGEKGLAVSHLGIVDSSIKVIYNGVKDYYATLDTSCEKEVISFSRFTFQKNMMASLEIARKMDCKFVWVGDGDELSDIKLIIQEEKISNIDLVGFKSNPQMYFKKGSIYLSTARHEGLPLALLEAASCGIPIIATNVVGNNEVVQDGLNGFLFEEGNIQDAINKIQILLNDDKLYEQFSNKARVDYLERFTIDRMVAETEVLYN
jgi:glycosyltransferase involved in cell wall biosynthesis